MAKSSKHKTSYVIKEKINITTSLVAFCFTVLGSTILIARTGLTSDAWKIVGLCVYCFTLMFVFIIGSIRHIYNAHKGNNNLLGALEYDSTFLLIAGASTAIVLIDYRTFIGWFIFGVIWFFALMAIVIRSAINLEKNINDKVYVLLSWIPSAVFLIKDKFSIIAILLLALGGIIYSFGFLIYVNKKLIFKKSKFGYHEIWHVLTILAATSQYLLMSIYILPSK